jgi:hypothetical protein
VLRSLILGADSPLDLRSCIYLLTHYHCSASYQAKRASIVPTRWSCLPPGSAACVASAVILFPAFDVCMRRGTALRDWDASQRVMRAERLRAACLFSVVLRSLLACLCLHVMGCDACEEGSSSSYLIVGESVLARGRRRPTARCDGCSRMPFVCLDLTYIFTITTMGGCLIDDASLVGKT